MPALTAAELEALGVAREVAANARMTAAGFVGDAAAYERDANQRSIAAGFTSAVDQEIDANRRAREAGFLNAAVKENPAAAAPGTSIYSTDPFIDPRSAAASANNLSSQNWVRPSGGGLVNYAVPSFRSPAYEDWTRFMPTDFQLAEYGGMHYQPGRGLLPSGTSTTGTSGVGTRYTPTYTPNTGVNTGVNTGGTKYAGVIPGSDKEKDLDAGRTHHVEMYDANDAWVGAEGTEVGGRNLLGTTQRIGGDIGVNASDWVNPNLELARQYDARMISNPANYTGIPGANMPTDAGLLAANRMMGGPLSPGESELSANEFQRAATARALLEQGGSGAMAARLGQTNADRNMALMVARQEEDARIAANEQRNQLKSAQASWAAVINAEEERNRVAQVIANANKMAPFGWNSSYDQGLMTGQTNIENAIARQAEYNRSLQNMGPQYATTPLSASLENIFDYNASINKAMEAQKIATAWAGGNLLGEFDVSGPEVEVEVDTPGGSGDRGMMGGRSGFGPGN